jgi:hypothetical protein
MTIWERVYTALSGLGKPLAASVYIPESGEELPDSYLVYFMVDNPAELHADNAEKLRQYRVQVSYYSRSGLVSMPDIEGAMTVAGFTRLPGRELPYNPDTRHFGIALDFAYLDEE